MTKKKDRIVYCLVIRKLPIKYIIDFLIYETREEAEYRKEYFKSVYSVNEYILEIQEEKIH